MCKGFARAAVVMALVSVGSVEARDVSRAGELATAASAPRAAETSRPWLAGLVRDAGLEAEQDGSAIVVTIGMGGEPISLMVRSESQALTGRQVAIWSTLLCVDEDLASSPALARALSKVTESAPDRISARHERGQLVVVYESSLPSRGLTAGLLHSMLYAEATEIQRALRLLRAELAKPSAGG